MTTQAITRIEVIHNEGVPPASVAARLALPAGSPREEATALANFFAGLAAGESARLRVAIDSSAEVAAALSLAVTQANIAVAEYLEILVPGIGVFRCTAVASAADVTLGQFVSETDDNTTATNIRAAINGMIGLKDWVIASGATNAVIVTARRAGTQGNSYKTIDGTANGLTPAGGLLVGGLDASARVTGTVVCVVANTDADDTLTIGATVLTAKAGDAAGESQFNIGATNTAMGDNLAACINAHSGLLGIVTAVAVTGTVTLTYQVPARLALHIRLATSDADGIVITQPSTTLTLASQQIMRSYALGAPA